MWWILANTYASIDIKAISLIMVTKTPGTHYKEHETLINGVKVENSMARGSKAP